MEALTAFLSLSLAFVPTTLAAPTKGHSPGGTEHIVLVRNDQDLPPRVEDVMDRLALHTQHPDVRRVFNNSAFVGFSATMQSHCLDQLAAMTDISIVEPATNLPRTDTRANAPWGLQRISSPASRLVGNSESLDFTYSFSNDKLGSGADIYMIDTGIYTANNIFSGRARMLWSFDGKMTDDDGHGTHTAGTAGGDILGVASNANIFGIKALDKDVDGWSSDVVGAIDKVIQYHDYRRKQPAFLGSVLSMSLAASGNVQAINTAIQAAVRSGVHAVVAAGNDGEDACMTSPSSSGGRHGPAITVGAIDQDSQRASFSNYGPCVDVYAPGVGVISAWIGGPNMINSLSGTSMATPHVTGLVAYAMANATLASNPALMKEWVGITALRSSGDLLVANNGVLPSPFSASTTHRGTGHDQSDGYVARVSKAKAEEETRRREGFADAKARRPVPTSRCQKDKKTKRTFSGLDSLLACRRSEDGVLVKGARLCNAKRQVEKLFSR